MLPKIDWRSHTVAKEVRLVRGVPPRRLIGLAIATLLATGLILVTACAPQAQAQKPADFYQGKTINIVIGGSSGTGVDLVPRTITPLLQNKTGAKVAIEYGSGAGGMEGVNNVYLKGTRDGLSLLSITPGSAFLNEALAMPGIQFKAGEFNWLISFTPTPYVFCVPAKSPHNSLADLQKAKGLKFGTASVGGLYAVTLAAIIDAASLDAKMVAGMAGGTAIALGLQKGEIDGAVLPEYIAGAQQKAGNLKTLFALYNKSTIFPEIPVLPNLIKLPPENDMVLKTWGSLDLGLATAPGVPQDRVDFLRKVLKEIAEDKELQPALAKANQMSTYTGYISGEEVQKLMSVDQKELATIIAKLKAWLDKYKA